MTTIAKADELATLRAALDVERAQNETLHAELAARRDQRILACEALSRATLLLVAAATWGREQTLGKLGRTVRREDVEHTALSLVRDVAELLRLDPGDDLAHVLGKMLGDADRERFAASEAPTQPEGGALASTVEGKRCAICNQTAALHGLGVLEAQRAAYHAFTAKLPQPDAPPDEDEIGRALAEQCTCGGIAGGRACASTCALFGPPVLVDVDECIVCGERLIGHPAMTPTQHGFIAQQETKPARPVSNVDPNCPACGQPLGTCVDCRNCMNAAGAVKDAEARARRKGARRKP